MTRDSCTLCGLPTPEPPVTGGDDVDGAFCCRGCMEVARTLEDPAAMDAAGAADSLDTGADTTDVDGEAAFLSVSGMHCATCEAFVEAQATDTEGVRAASASYPTETLKVTYDPETVDREAVRAAVDGLGYSATERDGDAAADDDESEVGRLLVGGFFGMMTMLWYVLFLYPAYLDVPSAAQLLDLGGLAGSYLLANVWLMATVVLAYTGYPLFRGAYVSLRAGHPNMDLLVGIAAGAAYVFSTATILTGGREVYFDVAIVVVLAVTVGDYYEGRVKRAAAGRLADLTEERVDDATRRRADGTTETVAIEELQAGDEVVVGTGERIPVDGVVTSGSATVDESLVTGESTPVGATPGDDAVGGAVVTDGRLVVAVGDDAASTLDRVVRVLWDVQSARPGVQRLVDRVAAVFVPLVVVLAGVAGGWHLLAGGAAANEALLVGLSVLVVSCPCALGLATPLAVARGVQEALDGGVVVTDVSAFEAAPAVDTVVFDKTGTLTTGEMRVRDVVGDDGVLARAAAVEQYADHPVAAAITDDATPAGDIDDFERVPGRGVAGSLAVRPDGAAAAADAPRVVAGNRALFDDRGWRVPEAYAERAGDARANGNVPVFVGWDGEARGVVVAGDRPRDEWTDVVSTLDADGRDVVVVTGDDPEAAARFRDHDAIAAVFAGVPPEGKTEAVRSLRADGDTVAMVGDGVNDAPALAAADLGVALDHAALAADAADAVVTTEDLGAVPRVFALTDATNGRIRQNLAWAFCYNAIAVPLAVAGVLNPLFAAGAMTVSSLLVVGNSTRSLLDDGVAGP
ncbi:MULTISPECIES: heavy metal translocating P-type ATPase [Halobacterium]|uniref:heavy metal translocating P-type ATPase n=1 Tax=Halobacterium TaxID=2239 RepID=UPI0019636B7A|nr:heavy metal translocating P-type ATPase [Halobacterium sp. GSL-19]QRY22381.1 heavy metal translocating P-type ATPase [Halobacterium sp. GSL-19]